MLSALRDFSKDLLSRKHRVEVAAAIDRLGSRRVHATMIEEHLERRVPLAKISAELSAFERCGLLRKVNDDGTRASVYEVQQTVFFGMAARLEEEVRGRGGQSLEEDGPS